MTPPHLEAASYVALGDSISIDDYAGGPGRGGASLLFRNRDDDFPDWRGRDLASVAPGSDFALLATDGATVRTVLDRQLPRLAAASRPPAVVTLTAGGNDVLAAYGDTRGARATIATVRAGVARVLDEVRRLAPEAVLVLGTVYDPSDGTGDAAALGLPPWPDGVAVLGELNAELAAVAAAAGAELADVAAAFQGHGVLAGSPAQSSPRPPSRELWYCNVIEPNAWGASGVRAAFWAALRRRDAGPAGRA
jgi:lysophospholipase L1-like esterase